MILALIREMESLYGEIDRQVAAFQLATGLRCRPGCGHCCPGAPVQATVVEMLPAAAALIRARLADPWLDRLGGAGETCAGFSTRRVAPGAGHCTLYSHRPAVCRLFGFAARQDRWGRRELSICRIIKADLPEAVAHAVRGLDQQMPVPCLTAYQARIFGLEPGARLMPINQALGRALQRCGLALTLEESSTPLDLPRAG